MESMILGLLKHSRTHSTERGSAGSTALITLVVEVDPALPRSVLCALRDSFHQVAEGNQ